MNLVKGLVGIVKLSLKALCASYLGQKLTLIGHVLGTQSQFTELFLRLSGLVVVPKLVEVKNLRVGNLAGQSSATASMFVFSSRDYSLMGRAEKDS